MVSFQCDACSDTVKKPKLDKHYASCHAPFTCLDCLTTFHSPAEYKGHTTCISEAEKYQKGLYKGPKGQQSNGSRNNGNNARGNENGRQNASTGTYQSRGRNSGPGNPSWGRGPTRYEATGANVTPLGTPAWMSRVTSPVPEPTTSGAHANGDGNTASVSAAGPQESGKDKKRRSDVAEDGPSGQAAKTIDEPKKKKAKTDKDAAQEIVRAEEVAKKEKKDKKAKKEKKEKKAAEAAAEEPIASTSTFTPPQADSAEKVDSEHWAEKDKKEKKAKKSKKGKDVVIDSQPAVAPDADTEKSPKKAKKGKESAKAQDESQAPAKTEAESKKSEKQKKEKDAAEAHPAEAKAVEAAEAEVKKRKRDKGMVEELAQEKKKRRKSDAVGAEEDGSSHKGKKKEDATGKAEKKEKKDKQKKGKSK